MWGSIVLSLPLQDLFTNVRHKSVCLWQSLSILVQYLWVRQGAYPRAEHPNVGSMGLAQALLKKIRLGWKGLQWTNTLTYYKYS